MKYLLLLILLIALLCEDYRRPTRTQRKCFVKKIGKDLTNELLKSLSNYHNSYDKATLLDYILDRRPDLNVIADECLLSMKRRRMDKNQNTEDRIIKYYLNSILKDKKAKISISNNLNINYNLGLNACKQYLLNQQICPLLLKSMKQLYDNKK